MKNEQKLNSLAKDFAASRCGKVFEEIVTLLRQQWTSKSFEYIAKGLNTDQWEVEAAYDDTLMRVLYKFNGSDKFCQNLSAALKNARIDIGRKSTRLINKEVFSINEENEDETLTFEFADSFDLEESVIKKEDQRQLISSLCDPSKVDTLTIAVVNEFPNHDNPNALAKALGVERKTVDWRLRKLARNFDENKFGHYRDYLSA